MRQLHERQRHELEQFDLQTTRMGLDSAHIVESTKESYQYEDLDTASVRDSLLNLTTSASSTSFSTHQDSNIESGHSLTQRVVLCFSLGYQCGYLFSWVPRWHQWPIACSWAELNLVSVCPPYSWWLPLGLSGPVPG